MHELRISASSMGTGKSLMRIGIYALFFGLFAIGDRAVAGDLDTNQNPKPSEGALFGNLHGILGTEISSSNGRLLPLVNGGGKIA